MPFQPEALLDQVDGVLSDVVDLRRRIHRHPELGLQLPVTQQAVLDSLADLPLSVRTGTAVTSVRSRKCSTSRRNAAASISTRVLSSIVVLMPASYHVL